jgi:hypothetical protein
MYKNYDNAEARSFNALVVRLIEFRSEQSFQPVEKGFNALVVRLIVIEKAILNYCQFQCLSGAINRLPMLAHCFLCFAPFRHCKGIKKD